MPSPSQQPTRHRSPQRFRNQQSAGHTQNPYQHTVPTQFVCSPHSPPETNPCVAASLRCRSTCPSLSHACARCTCTDVWLVYRCVVEAGKFWDYTTGEVGEHTHHPRHYMALLHTPAQTRPACPSPTSAGPPSLFFTCMCQVRTLIRACWPQRELRRTAAAEVAARLQRMLDQVMLGSIEGPQPPWGK
jgi:hypothetical protein